jgi:hypothetical protein
LTRDAGRDGALARLLLEPERLRLRYAYAAALTHSAIEVLATRGLDRPGDRGAVAVPEDRSAAVLARAEEHLVETLRIVASVLGAFGWPVPALFREVVGEPLWNPARYEVPVASIPEAARQRTRRFVEGAFLPSTVVLLAGVGLERRRFRVGGPTEVLDPVQLAELAELAEGAATSYRVTYNLACFWSSSARDLPDPGEARGAADPRDRGEPGAELERALDHLGRAFGSAPIAAGRRLAQWALADPSLVAVRTDRQTQTRFATLVTAAGGTTKAPAPGELAGLRVVGPFGARLLATVGIEKPGDVSDDPRLGAIVADQLGVPVGYAASLIDALRVLSLPGMTVEIANLLERVGATSLADLARFDAPELRAALGGLDDDVDLPDLARFDHWIAEAGRRQR